MAKKHESETLRQQRLAREEFLKLKKIQSGEIPPEPKPSEIDSYPKTPEEKIKNFWFYYGKFLIVGLISVIVFVSLVVQCANKPKYDLKIVYFTYSPVADEVTNNLANYFSKYCDDINGDGKSNVSVINCSYNTNSTNDSRLIKMQAIISSESDTLLFITDEKSYKYFENLRSDKTLFFEEESFKLPSSLLEKVGINNNQELSMNLRYYKGTTIENSKDIKIYHRASKNLLERLK